MSAFIRAGIILLCVSLCSAGVIVSGKERGQTNEPAFKVTPINNHDGRASRGWLEV